MTNSNILTATISGTYSWNPGHGVLATLRSAPSEGYTRQGVQGTRLDFVRALEAAKDQRAIVIGANKTAHTALIKRLAAAIVHDENSERHYTNAEHTARFAELIA